MVETIKEKGLNRVVVAACTPRTHEPVFQDALREAGLNPYLFEFANIREQCSWVHMRDRQVATKKTQDLVRMAVAKAKLRAWRNRQENLLYCGRGRCPGLSPRAYPEGL
jgi:heterodisulfide reductase subunit A